MADDSLNDKQLKFCTEYAKHGNGTKAYCAAYPDASEKAATQAASRLLTNVKVSKKIQELRAETKAHSKITREKIAQELADMGFTTIDVSELKHSDKIKALEALAKILGFLDGNNKGAGDSEDQLDKRLSDNLERVTAKLSTGRSKS